MKKNPSNVPVDEEAVRSWLAVVRAYHQCSELMARRLAVEGVRTAEHEILANLLREPGLSQQQLAARCFTAKSHVSTLISDMETRGWLLREPDPADGRAKRLALTAAGARIARRTSAIQAEVVAVMTDGAPRSEIEQVRQSMVEVSRRLEAALDALRG